MPLKYKPKYPVRKWLGQFESWLLHLYGRNSMLYNDKYLERFFSHFPEASGLEQFGTPDILEYKTMRERTGDASAFKIMQEIKCLDRFFRYLIEDRKLPLTNPAKPFVKNVKLHSIVRRKKDSLRLHEYQRLIDICLKEEPRLIFWLMRMVQGIGSYDRSMNGRQASYLLRRVAKAAGLPHVTMRHIKISLRNGLWREIIKDWQNRFLADLGYAKGSNSKLKHIEPAGDPFGYIQITSDDVGASVSNPSENPLPIPGIDDPQERPEP
jgi:hypothetical protein